MAQLPVHKRGRTLTRLATTAIAAALIGTTAGTAAADTPAPVKTVETTVQSPTATRAANGESRAESPRFPLMASRGSGELYRYWPDQHGGFGDREQITDKWWGITSIIQVDLNQDGIADGHYFRTLDGSLYLTQGEGKAKKIGSGWNIYDRILVPGNLGGAKEPDLLARDQSGVLWIYLAYPDGTLSDRFRVGPGWDRYTDIVGRGDLDGDGKTDIVAKDRQGVLWFYKGTGDYRDPFQSRVRIGGGWDQYDFLVSTGDVDFDGRSDLLARDRNGVLWLYRGNGNQQDPFDNRTRIGGGWDQYNNLF